MKLSYLIVFLFFVNSVFSQDLKGSESTDNYVADATLPNRIDENSIITGTVIEESTGKPLPGVLVTIKGTKLATLSDAEGKFYFRKMPAGKYDLEFSFFSFSTKIVSDVEVVDKEATVLTVSLAEMSGVLDEVVVRTVKAKAESVKSLLTMQKNSVRVSDGISAESIKRTPDKTASDVLRRISGASVQNNKFVIIRGLNDRYNTTYLNGSPLPSTEPDRKAFSFDIFPSNMLDNLVINKTASPDLPGEFAGGVIEINTKMAPDKNFQTLSIGTGYNTVTTGKSKLVARDAKVGLPSNFPSSDEFINLQTQKTESSILQIDNLSKNYQTDWGIKEDKFDPNTSFQFSLGRYFKFNGEQSLGLLASVTNNTSNVYAESNRKFYDTPGALLEDFSDKSYSSQRLSGAILNLSLKINSNNKFSFKNLYSLNTETRFTDRNGTKRVEEEPTITSSTNRFFSKNNIYTGQFIGEHFLSESKIKINWVGSYSNVKRDIPSERRNTYEYIQYADGTQSVPTAYFFAGVVGKDSPGSIFTSSNSEYILSSKIDVSKKINFSDNFSADIKIGGITQSRNRKFEARQLGYIPFNGRVGGVSYGSGTFGNTTIPTMPNATIFNASNMGIFTPKSSGLTLYDGTKGSDYYDAEANLDAGYLMIDNVFNKLRVVWGVRLENYSQHLKSKSIVGEPVVVDDSQLDLLPSVNFIYKLTKNQNLRLSGSKTLNRPEFRELAPFLFFDNETRFNTSGTPTLKITEILNADLRYEFFPGNAQLFSVSAFYKDFKNPIEIQALANNSNQYKNAAFGTDYGIEFEFRTLLSTIFGTKETKILDDLTLYSNLAVIRSKVDISNLFETPSAVEDTPMQGQSPYVLNAGLQYMNSEAGWSISANLNRIGNRITIHANQTLGNPTAGYWEKARTLLDFQVAKSLFKNKLEIKMNLQNALAQDLVLYQNNDLPGTQEIKGFDAFVNKVFLGDSQNKNGYNSQEDDLTTRIKFGSSYSFSLTYNF
ncbi:outer membrane beta-barrel protein [Flavobacterium franklandianum]|uniref:Outer membrane beta-barrel protein n=1 Tax=Flavobacterium franklandianum TaxID=2594430 RepID=A0A553CTH8_9FLAO|nr:TonB-dependent receptor [Flavobacterium franklandianum]TRX23771.1 outer membrane beta-barrel protein [Flavobacterium franklandianum]TRX24524.1 outer membrane beta-barrel protein [Flavobacterium franklandianum]